MKKKSSITFVLGGSSDYPTGGLRTIYEYANRLSDRGWKVSLVHPARIGSLPPEMPFIKKLRWWFWYFRRLISRSYLPDRWFQLRPQVKSLYTPSLGERHIPAADYIIACPVESASFVNSCDVRKGKKFYFIQGYEDWAVEADTLKETWKMPLKKIVISLWLLGKAKAFGESAFYVPDAFDSAAFGVDIPFSRRNVRGILFIYHFLELKGCRYAIEAAVTLKEKFPDLVVEAFGICDLPPGFPEFITYHKSPSRLLIRELYNRSRVFIAPSLSEGWGLPAGEAMLCGCCVVATDIGGHREFLKDNENGLFCTPESATSIVEKVEWLFNNSHEAEKIASTARRSLRRFNWDSSVSLFEQALHS